MIKNCVSYPIIALAMACGLTACDKHEFRVSGRIDGASDVSLVLERPDISGRWVPLDSVRTGADGKFSISSPAPDHSEIYRLVLDDRYVYIPVEATESLDLSTTLAGFGTRYSLTGTEAAEAMCSFDMEANMLPALSDLDSVERFKRKVFNEIIRDSEGSLMSYYVLTKQIGDHLLFDPADAADSRYIAAVATAYKQYKPDDARTKFLEELALASMKLKNRSENRHNEIQAPEIDFIEIALPDIAGNTSKLSETVKSGRPTILAYSMLTDPKSPEINRGLAEIYKKYGENIGIYHIGYDSDVHAWTEVASSLPWTCVYDADGTDSRNLINYNVEQLPQFYIFDRSAQLVDKAYSLNELRAKLR